MKIQNKIKIINQQLTVNKSRHHPINVSVFVLADGVWVIPFVPAVKTKLTKETIRPGSWGTTCLKTHLPEFSSQLPSHPPPQRAISRLSTIPVAAQWPSPSCLFPPFYTFLHCCIMQNWYKVRTSSPNLRPVRAGIGFLLLWWWTRAHRCSEYKEVSANMWEDFLEALWNNPVVKVTRYARGGQCTDLTYCILLFTDSAHKLTLKLVIFCWNTEH